MKTILTAAALFAASAATPALAQVAVADMDAVLTQTAAFKAAQAQIRTTYKTQIDALNTRQQALAAQLQPLRTELETLQKNSSTPRATFDAKVAAYRAQEANAQRELETLSAPLRRPNAYIQAQLEDKLDAAIRAAMAAKGLKVILRQEAAIARTPDSDATADIVAQLNTLVPTVSITPPAAWQPGQPLNAPAPTKGR